MSNDFRDAKTEFNEPPKVPGAGEETVDLGPGGVPKQIGPYEVLGVLGQGGMGAVYRARDPSLQREVALKVLPPHVAADTEQTERFLREARVAARINSAHVITVHAVGEHDGLPYMALELVAGGDVDELTRGSPDRRLPERRALEIARDCARGLIAIERAGLVHRDIKPANVFLTEDGVAKLADLGLARSHSGEDQLTQTGTIVGTPAYMAPEQARGDRVDIRTDVYALGATLFGIVTGQAPFQGSSVFVIVSNVLNEPMPDPARLRPDLSDTTADLIRRACAKDPADRFDSAQALLDAIEHALEAAPRGRRIRPSSSAAAATVKEPAPTAQARTARAPAARAGVGRAPTVARGSGRPGLPGAPIAVAPGTRVPSCRMMAVGVPLALLSCCCLGGGALDLLSRGDRTEPDPQDVSKTTPEPTFGPTPGEETSAVEGPRRWLTLEATNPDGVFEVANPARIAYEPGPGLDSKVVFTDRRSAPWPVPLGSAGKDDPPGTWITHRTVWTIHRVETHKPPGWSVALGFRRDNHPVRDPDDIGPAMFVDLRFVKVPPLAGAPAVRARIVAINPERKRKRPRRPRLPLGRRPDALEIGVLESIPYDPSKPFTVVFDLSRAGWWVWLKHGDVERSMTRAWTKTGRGVLTKTLARGVYLFGAMGNHKIGQGRGGLSLQVAPRLVHPPQRDGK